MATLRSLSEGGWCAPDTELIMEDARSLREAMWRIARLARDGAEVVDARIEVEALDGRAEAVEVREALEQVQALRLGINKELDAYRERHAR